MGNSTMKTFRFSMLAIVCAAALNAGAPAFAGEINGRGDPVPAPDNAASVCSFSGLNDNPVNPPPGDFPGRVQNFGSFLGFLSDLLGFRLLPFDAPYNPGDACNPNNDFAE
jgi:hypothetical protein